MKILRYLPLLLLGASLGFAQPATTPYLSDSMSLQRYGTNGQQYFPTITLLQLQTLFAATNAQTIAGTSTTTFVTPAALQAWSGGGGGLGSMALQNSNNVSISGGTISVPNFNSNQGSNNTLSTTTLLGSVTMGNGVLGQGGFPVFASYPMPAFQIDVTQQWNTVNLTDADTGHPSEVLTFSGTPGNATQQFACLVTNTSTTVVHTPTIPSSFSYNRGATTTTFTIQPLTSALLVWDYDGTTYWLRGDPVFYSDLNAKSTPVTADLLSIGDSTSSYYTAKKTTFAQAGPVISIKSIVFSFNGNGGVLTTGVKYGGVVKIPYGGTITGYALACYPAAVGTNSFDLLRSANAGGTPASSIVGGGTKPFVNASTSTSTTENSALASGLSWTSTTLTALDNLVAQITAADGTIQYATLTVYYQ